jgi:hypothetical protein
MAGNAPIPPTAIEVIDISDLADVRGGLDKQTEAVQQAIAQVTTMVGGLAKSVAPKSDSMTALLMMVMNMRRSGSGPTPAPALPPTSTLTR